MWPFFSCYSRTRAETPKEARSLWGYRHSQPLPSPTRPSWWRETGTVGGEKDHPQPPLVCPHLQLMCFQIYGDTGTFRSVAHLGCSPRESVGRSQLGNQSCTDEGGEWEGPGSLLPELPGVQEHHGHVLSGDVGQPAMDVCYGRVEWEDSPELKLKFRHKKVPLIPILLKEKDSLGCKPTQ